MMSQDIKVMSGLKIGDWTVLDVPPVLKRYGNAKRTTSFWLCRCVCGRQKYVQGHALRCGRSTKCKNCSKRKSGSAFRSLIGKYKQNAERRGIEFLLTSEQFFSLTQKNCFYCDALPANICKSKRDTESDIFVYSGIDRRDNSAHYTIDNCVSCCCPCNQSKMDSAEDEFIERCKRIARRFS